MANFLLRPSKRSESRRGGKGQADTQTGTCICMDIIRHVTLHPSRHIAYV